MAALDDLNKAVSDLQAESALVIAFLATLNGLVADLKAALAAAQNSDPAVAAAAAAVEAEVAKLAVAIAPPA